MRTAVFQARLIAHFPIQQQVASLLSDVSPVALCAIQVSHVDREYDASTTASVGFDRNVPRSDFPERNPMLKEHVL